MDTSDEFFSRSDVLLRLRNAIEEAGSRKAFAIDHGLGLSEISETLSRRHPPTRRLLAALGFSRVDAYVAREVAA